MTPRCSRARQGLAQEFAEVGQHPIRFVHSMLPHQHNDCIERVEKKMRVELHLERAQPCLCELTFKLSGVQLELRRQALAFHELAIVANAVLNADYRPIDDHIQMKIDRQDGQKGSGKLPRKPGHQAK